MLPPFQSVCLQKATDRLYVGVGKVLRAEVFCRWLCHHFRWGYREESSPWRCDHCPHPPHPQGKQIVFLSGHALPGSTGICCTLMFTFTFTYRSQVGLWEPNCTNCLPNCGLTFKYYLSHLFLAETILPSRFYVLTWEKRTQINKAGIWPWSSLSEGKWLIHISAGNWCFVSAADE